MATGSYEGFLLTEGIPDHHEASAFTSRRPRWSSAALASSDPSARRKKRETVTRQHHAKAGEA